MKKLLVFLVVAALPLAASAALVTYDIRYVTTLDASYTDIGDQSATFTGGGYDPTWTNQFELYVSISGLVQYEDLKQLSFGFGYSGGVIDPGFGLVGNLMQTTTYDANGGSPGGLTTVPIFSAIEDSGISGDMRGWLASINAGPAFSSQFGEAAAGFVASDIFVQWDGVTNGDFSAFGDPPEGSTYVTWLDNRYVVGRGYSNTIDASVRPFEGDAIQFRVPEPATMGLLAIGALGLLRRRR